MPRVTIVFVCGSRFDRKKSITSSTGLISRAVSHSWQTQRVELRWRCFILVFFRAVKLNTQTNNKRGKNSQRHGRFNYCSALGVASCKIQMVCVSWLWWRTLRHQRRKSFIKQKPWIKHNKTGDPKLAHFCFGCWKKVTGGNGGMTKYISIVASLESIYGSMLLTVGCVTGGSSSSRLLRIDSRRRRRRSLLCCFVSVSPLKLIYGSVPQ